MIRRPIGRTVARTAVIAGTATAVSGRVARRQEERYESKEAAQAPQAQYVEAPPEAETASVGPSPEAIEQLKQLAALKDQGILTEEEFSAQKAKILGS
jgi:Short C-terminal domain